MTWHLRTRGHKVNIKRIRRLMRLMPIHQKPNPSRPNKGHKIYPYLLRHLNITQANHVWCADITYIPMHKGFLYLVAIMDWATRKVLSWRLSNTMDAEFVLMHLMKPLPVLVHPKYLTLTKVANLHHGSGPIRCNLLASKYIWTAKIGSGTAPLRLVPDWV